MTTGNFRNAAMFLMAIITLTSCLDEQDSTTESYGYATIVEDDGTKLVAMESNYYGTTSFYLRPTISSTLDDYEAGDRVITSYTINWDKQTDTNDNTIFDADIYITTKWKSESIVDRTGEEGTVEFVSDTIQTLLAPFITYNSNGKSVLTTAGVMQGIAAGGSSYTFELERLSEFDMENLTDTLYVVLNEGDVDEDKDQTAEYKSFVLPQGDYGTKEVTLIVRFVASTITGNYEALYYLDDEKTQPYIQVTYKNPYFD